MEQMVTTENWCFVPTLMMVRGMSFYAFEKNVKAICGLLNLKAPTSQALMNWSNGVTYPKKDTHCMIMDVVFGFEDGYFKANSKNDFIKLSESDLAEVKRCGGEIYRVKSSLKYHCDAAKKLQKQYLEHSAEMARMSRESDKITTEAIIYIHELIYGGKK